MVDVQFDISRRPPTWLYTHLKNNNPYVKNDTNLINTVKDEIYYSNIKSIILPKNNKKVTCILVNNTID